MKARCLCLALAALWLGACAVGPDYERPAASLPDYFRGQPAGQDNRSLAQLKWWELFQDRELQAILREALANNHDLRLAAAQLLEARAQARSAGADLFPSVGGYGTTQPKPFSSDSPAGSTYMLGLQMAWELDFFGRLRRSSEAAQARMLASEEGRRAVVTSLVRDVAQAWFDLRALDEQLAITRGTVASLESSLKLVDLMKRAGTVSRAEQLQAANQLATTAANVHALEKNLAAQENKLCLLLGRHPGVLARSAASAPLDLAPAIPAGLPSALLERRPDIRQAEQKLAAATANIGAVKAGSFPFPTIGLTGFFGQTSTDLGRLLKFRDDDIPSLGPTLNWPLLDFGRGAAAMDKAEAQAQQAAISYAKAILQALREVADALTGHERLTAEIAQQQTRVDTARDMANVAALRFRAGIVNYLEVLDAQRQLYSAEIDLSRVAWDRVKSVVELYRALGGGWEEQVEAAPAARVAAGLARGPQ